MNQINAKQIENKIEVCYWGSVVGVAIRCGIDGVWEQSGLSVALITHPLLGSRSSMGRAIPRPPLCACLA